MQNLNDQQIPNLLVTHNLDDELIKCKCILCEYLFKQENQEEVMVLC
jgi:hypothetical protein